MKQTVLGFQKTKTIDSFTSELMDKLFQACRKKTKISNSMKHEIENACRQANKNNLTRPIIDLFAKLLRLREAHGVTPDDLGITREYLISLSLRHESMDEHGVTVGGRLLKAAPIVEEIDQRIKTYLAQKDTEAPTGIELWDKIKANIQRIKKILKMSENDWCSFSGQLRHAIDSVDTLAKVIDLPPIAVQEVLRMTKSYRMRITPYYAALIEPSRMNDPVLIQCVPTGEMMERGGDEIPPVAADHSPARLIDQFYPRVVTIKVTNMCAMFCTHCLRIAHIGKKDRIYGKEAYQEAFEYIRRNSRIRDVLLTGGDTFMLPNEMIRWLLNELDSIDHVTVKRVGTRIPVTAPMRIDDELLDILGKSNDLKPVRVATQINTVQEITPLSKEGFRKISKNVSALLNQSVLLKGINDTRLKMWKLCETIQDAYVRPYYLFNCSYRNPQFAHLRVPVDVGRDIVENMYGNISGDAIPRYISTAGGKIPMHRDNIIGREGNDLIFRKPWSGEKVCYPDADPAEYEKKRV